MTIEERKQELFCYLEQLEREIENLKENISELRKRLDKIQSDGDFEMLLKCYDIEKGLNFIELI